MPRVSVIIPNYNHARFLRRRIESVLAQTYEDFEVLLLDDASTDNSLEIIAQYENDPRIRIVCNEQNSGTPFKQWNKGVDLARGELIWIAESDDWADPRLLQVLVDLLEKNSSVGVAYSQSHKVDENDQITGSMLRYNRIIKTGEWESDFIRSGRELCHHFLRINIIPNASAVVFRKRVYLDVGGAPEDMRLAGDMFTWAKMLHSSDVAYVTDHLNYHRYHDATNREQSSATPGFIRDTLRIIEWLDENVELPPSEVRQASRNACRWWRKSARKHLGVFTFRANIRLALLAGKLTVRAYRTFLRIELYRIREKLAKIRRQLPWSVNG